MRTGSTLDELQAVILRTRLACVSYRATVRWARQVQREARSLRAAHQRERRRWRWLMRNRGPLPRVIAGAQSRGGRG
jgi:hypothetical protein